MHPAKARVMRSLLIVDSNRSCAEALAERIASAGYVAQIATIAEHALALLRHPPDDGLPAPVALVEISLRHGSGLNLLPRLRLEQPELVCAVMSNGIDAGTAVAALRRGAFDYFDRSGERSALLPMLDRCFDEVRVRLAREATLETLRLAKIEAEEASKAKSTFLATISHELRTPLNAILGFSEMMQKEVLGRLGNEQYRSYASDIHDSGSHLLLLINDILDLSKAEAGKLSLIEEVFDLRDIVRSVAQLMHPRIRGAGLSFAIEMPELPLLRGDQRKVKQVLLNLVGNASKFTPPGGSVRILAGARLEQGLSLTVEDTGIGIATIDLARVLEPFEQVDSSLGRKNYGTGLGLPLVKAIMELHGGRLDLRSTVGDGTRAEIVFPPERLVYGVAGQPDRSAA